MSKKKVTPIFYIPKGIQKTIAISPKPIFAFFNSTYSPPHTFSFTGDSSEIHLIWEAEGFLRVAAIMVITLFVFVGFLQQTDMYLLDVLTNASCLLNIFICFLCFLSHPFRLSYLYLLWLWDVDHVNIRSLICMLHRSQALPLAAIM